MAKRREKQQQPDSDRKICLYDEHGTACGLPGHLSTGVTGGPWYCRNHFARVMGWGAWEAATPKETQATVDARVNKRVPRAPGESEHAWSMRCRDWAITNLARI